MRSMVEGLFLPGTGRRTMRSMVEGLFLPGTGRGTMRSMVEGLFLPGTGRGTMRSMVEGRGAADPLAWAPSRITASPRARGDCATPRACPKALYGGRCVSAPVA
jgi:hypothetical protein